MNQSVIKPLDYQVVEEELKIGKREGESGGGAKVEFQGVADYVAPTWPEGDKPQMFHLDLTVEDLPAAHERAVGIGAKLLDEQKTFRVYADPAGHPFCLCAC